MAELLCKFRIDFSDVVMIPDVTRRPREESLRDFNNLISKFKVLPAGGTEGGLSQELDVFTGWLIYHRIENFISDLQTTSTTS